jgi:transposase InsO family protein
LRSWTGSAGGCCHGGCRSRWRAAFCVEALQEEITRHGQPDIFNTDQGVQFTSAGFLGELESRGIRISMDGKGRFLDNIFIERLWHSLKYEDVFIKAYGSVAQARQSIGGWLRFYNEERLHQALGYRTPCAVFDGEARLPVDNASALKGCGVAHRVSAAVSPPRNQAAHLALIHTDPGRKVAHHP